MISNLKVKCPYQLQLLLHHLKLMDIIQKTGKQELDRICYENDISQEFAMELRNIISAHHKVVIVDNSGSMKSIVTETHLSMNQLEDTTN